MKYPFDYVGKNIIVQSLVKDLKGGEFTRLSLKLDTGAEKTCIDEKVVAQMGFDLDTIKPTAGFYSATSSSMAKVVHLNTFALFNRKERNFPIYVYAFPSEFGTVQGLVGMDFIERLHKFKIDFDIHEIEVP
jgi:predicted aspartyl protease